jgi:plasmid stability protein
MRTTLDLPDELFRTLKARAALEGTTLKEIVQRLVRAGLAAGERDGVPRTPSRLPLPVRGGRRKMKAYTNADLAALADSLTDD